MVNRTIEQKRLKIKRKGRFARFTGGQSKYVTLTLHGRYTEVTQTSDGDLIPSGKVVTVAVGPVSLSKGVMSTGRGPDAERMAEYYSRINAKSYSIDLPEDFDIKDPRYRQVWEETPNQHKLTFINNELYRLDLFYTQERCFFVETDYVAKKMRRSREYGSLAMAKANRKRIQWVHEIELLS